ncbi:MAG: SsrA-binding protein SmpB [bacterium]|nr:SsrA-binding protein SmpB [bacterium]
MRYTLFVAEALIYNKKIGLDYEILETFEAGLELFGLEVKSIRARQGSLLGSHVTIRGGEAYLIESNIPPFQEKNTPKEYNPRRNRRLLLTKEEIFKLASLEAKKGLTIVPISVYSKGRKIKAEIAIVRGKKIHDKRQDIKKREVEREIRREFSDR